MNSNSVHASHPVQYTPSDDTFAYFDFGAFENDEQPGNAEDPVPTQPHPNFLGPSSDQPVQHTPSDDTFAYFDFEGFEADGQPGDTEDPVSAHQQPNVLGPSSGHPVQHTPSDDPSAHFDFGAFETDEQPGDTEDPVSTQPHPDFAGSSSDPSPFQSPITPPPVTTTVNRWPCPMCPQSFPREQERNRHELTHIPFFLHCPLPHCRWRGNRAYSFRIHWQKADHLSYHQHYGHAPEGSQIETFKPHVILDLIKDGAISLTDGEVIATDWVKMKGRELQKLHMWTNLWGRKKS